MLKISEVCNAATKWDVMPRIDRALGADDDTDDSDADRSAGKRYSHGGYGATRHMCSTRNDMHQYEPCKGVNVRTAANEKLSKLGIDESHLGLQQGTLRVLIPHAVLHVSNLKKNLLSLRAIDEGGLDCVGKNGVLTVGKGRIRLMPKDKLYAFESYQMPKDYPNNAVEDSPSEDVATKAVIAPSNPRPCGIDGSIYHSFIKTMLRVRWSVLFPIRA